MLKRLRDERGIALVSALLISMVLVSISVAVVTLSVHNVEQSSNDRKRLQAINTAEAGLGATESLLQTTTTSALPCTGDAVLHATLPTSPSSEYTTSIDYYNKYPPSGTPMTCSAVRAATVLPKAAQITSSGTAVISGQHGAVTRTMETLVRMNPIRSGFQQAIFSDKDIILNNNLNVNGNIGNDGDVYTNGKLICNNSSVIKGSLLVQGYVELGNSCSVAQDVWTKGHIKVSNSATIGHDATASSVDPDGTPADISFFNANSYVTHNATAARSCTNCPGHVGGAITPNHVSTNPPRIDLPKINYVPSCWADPASCDADVPIAPFTNFVNFTNCSTSGAGNTQDTIDAGYTSNTVVRITSNCILPWQNNTTVNVRANMAIITDGGFSTINQTTFQSADGTPHDLYLIVPWEATTGGNLTGGTPDCSSAQHDMAISNQTTFSNLHVFMYTPCKVSYNNNNSGLGGQVLAGQVEIDNLYNLSFYPLRIPGAGPITGYRVDISYEREIVNP